MRRKRKQQKRLLEERLRDLQRLEAMEAAAEGEGLDGALGLSACADRAICSRATPARLPRLWLEARGGQRLHLIFWLPPRGRWGRPLASFLLPGPRGWPQPQCRLADLRLLGLPVLCGLMLRPLGLVQSARDRGPPVAQQ